MNLLSFHLPFLVLLIPFKFSAKFHLLRNAFLWLLSKGGYWMSADKFHFLEFYLDRNYNVFIPNLEGMAFSNHSAVLYKGLHPRHTRVVIVPLLSIPVKLRCILFIETLVWLPILRNVDILQVLRSFRSIGVELEFWLYVFVVNAFKFLYWSPCCSVHSWLARIKRALCKHRGILSLRGMLPLVNYLAQQ